MVLCNSNFKMKLSLLLKSVLLLVGVTSCSGGPAPAPVPLQYIVWVTSAGGVMRTKQYNQKACTGTLIRHDLVMTLASCLLLDAHEDPYPDIIRVHERPSDHILPVLKIFINPNFYSQDRRVSKSHDFALILVENSKQSVYPVLPKKFRVFSEVKDTCVMGGYGSDGSVNIGDNFSVIRLNETDVRQFRGRACLDPTKICLHFFSMMACEADFGTPLICDGVLYAMFIPRYNHYDMVPMVPRCFDLYIASFNPVFNVMDWVVLIMEVPTSNLEWLGKPWYVLLLCCIVFLVMGSIYYTLVEFLQRTFDPSEGLTQTTLPVDDKEDDEESWYESQWVSR